MSSPPSTPKARSRLRWLPAVAAAFFVLALSACGGHPAARAADASITPEPSATAAPVVEPTHERTAVPELAIPGAREGDRVSISKIGVNASISTKTVGVDGQMPNPNGPDDIAFYEFDPQYWPGYGGRPGSGGNVILAGHVDWGVQHSGLGCKNNTVRPPCQAVLWDLGKLKAGDELDIQVGDAVFKYQITGTKSYAATYSDWASVLTSQGQEVITIITCTGDFNPSTHEYGSRRVVSGVRVA